MAFGRRQATGILGMTFAVLGAVAWFFQQYIPAAILWSLAVIIVFKLNKKRPTGKS
jgi:hypothetical protein